MTAAGQSGAQLPGHGQQCEGLSHYSNSSDFQRDGFNVAADLEVDRKILAAVFLVVLPALVVLGCVIAIIFFK